MMDFIKFFPFMLQLRRRMVTIKETMSLTEVSRVYSEYVCKMHNWKISYIGGLTDYFCEISFSFMNGYIKALHDNGLEFKNGLVKKRHITEDMPCGALKYYREDAIKETKEKSVEALRKVMGRYETSKTNINIIVSAFEEEIKEV